MTESDYKWIKKQKGTKSAAKFLEEIISKFKTSCNTIGDQK